MREVAPTQRNSNVAGLLAGPAEERQIARTLGVRQPAGPPTLLAGVPGEPDSLLEEHLLNERRAVVPGGAPAAPEIGRAEERGHPSLEAGTPLSHEGRGGKEPATAVGKLDLGPAAPDG